MIKDGDLANFAESNENTNHLKIQERRRLNIILSFGLLLEDCFKLKVKVL